MRYLLWVGELQGVCDVIQDGRHQKWRKLQIVNATHVKYDIIKHFAAFCVQFALFSPKKAKYTVLPKINFQPATYDVISRNHRN